METEDSVLEVKSINDLVTSGYEFIIPSFQRGFRWRKRQVRDLLNDIWEFYNNDNNPGEFYNLQTIIVKPEDGKYLVVDGQQRLTIIAIIMNLFSDACVTLGLPHQLSIDYEVRKTKSFLENGLPEEKKDANIDFHFMWNAKNTIEKWVKEKPDGNKSIILNTLLKALLKADKKNVRVIWYELNAENRTLDPRNIFSQINIGKIPLTSSELVRALILRRDNFNKNTTTEFKRERSSLRQLEISKEWDEIEYNLRKDDLWFFLREGMEETKEHNQNRIEFIFDLWAEKQQPENFENFEGEDYRTFYIFDDWLGKRLTEPSDDTNLPECKESSILNMWRKEQVSIKNLYRTFIEWFRNRKYYHKIGYLLALGEDIQNILDEYQNSVRNDFEHWLENEIWDKTFEAEEKERELLEDEIEALEYGSDNQQIENILLLFNIAWVLKNEDSGYRFSFRCFKNENWELEHIKAVQSQLPEALEDKLAWLKVHRKYLDKIESDELKSKVDDYIDNKRRDELEFLELAGELICRINKKEEMNADDKITNLTLLDSRNNKLVSNSIFREKRKRIIESDKKGSFIPICTRNVYLKYFSYGNDLPGIWDPADDGEKYKKEIFETLLDFFGLKNHE